MTIPWLLAKQLTEHLVHRSSLGKTMSMPAVGAGDVIFPLQRLTDSDRDGFLADVKMREPGHLRASIQLIDLFFKGTDLEHLLVHMQPLFTIHSGYRRIVIRLLRFYFHLRHFTPHFDCAQRERF